MWYIGTNEFYRKHVLRYAYCDRLENIHFIDVGEQTHEFYNICFNECQKLQNNQIILLLYHKQKITKSHNGKKYWRTIRITRGRQVIWKRPESFWEDQNHLRNIRVILRRSVYPMNSKKRLWTFRTGLRKNV